MFPHNLDRLFTECIFIEATNCDIFDVAPFSKLESQCHNLQPFLYQIHLDTSVGTCHSGNAQREEFLSVSAEPDQGMGTQMLATSGGHILRMPHS